MKNDYKLSDKIFPKNYYAYIRGQDDLGYLFMHVSVEYDGKTGPFVMASTVPEDIIRLHSKNNEAYIAVFQHVIYGGTLHEAFVGSAFVADIWNLPMHMLFDIVSGLVIGHLDALNINFPKVDEVFFLVGPDPIQPALVELTPTNDGESDDDDAS